MTELKPKSDTVSAVDSRLLASTQAMMATSIMRPLYSSEGMREPSAVRDAIFESTAATLFKPSWSLTAADRLEIYNKQYWFRILDSLLEDFPGLHAILGAEKFDSLITAYVTAHPSTTYSLRDLGSLLPNFILNNPEYTGKKLSAAHQMSAFEWAAIEAFDRKRYPTIPVNAIASENPDALVLVLQPYISLIESDFALDDFALSVDKHSAQHGVSTALVSRGQKKQKTKRPEKEHVFLVVHRQQNSVYYKRVDAEQFKILQLIKSGTTLGEICKMIANDLTPVSLSTFPDRLKKSFAEWMELGWFADPTSMPGGATQAISSS
jgi:hypothetical protein